MKKFLLSLLLVIGLSGCDTLTVSKVTTYTIDATTILNSYVIMKERLSTLESMVVPDNVSYSREERIVLQGLATQSVLLADKIKTLIPHDKTQIKTSIITYAALDNIVYDTRRVYKEMAAIISPKFDEYTTEQQTELRMMNAAVKNANRIWQKIELKKAENMDKEVVNLLTTIIDLAAVTLTLYDTAKTVR